MSTSTVHSGRAVTFTCALALLLSTGAGAFAQTGGRAEELREAGIEEIVVYTRKREEAILDVPVSVTAFTEEVIDNLAPSTLRDLDGLSPNVFIGMNTAGPSASAIYIRGQGYADIEKTQSPSVGVVVDNVFLGSSTAQLVDTFDVEQVEINRGPQTILYGKNTSGGTIVIRRRKPDFEQTGARFRASFGNFDGEGDGDAWTVQGVFNTPLEGTDSLALRVGYTVKGSEGYVQNVVTGESRGEVDYESFVTKLRFRPSENFEALFGWDFIRDRGDIPPQDPTFDGGQAWTNRSDRNPSEAQLYDANILSLDLTWDTGIGVFQSVTTHVNSTDRVLQDFDGSTCGDGTYAGCLGAGNGAGAIDNSFPFAQLHTDRDQNFDTFSQELRWSDSFIGDRLTLTAGVFIWHHEIDLTQRSGQITQLPPAALDATATSCAGIRLPLGPGGALVPVPFMTGANPAVCLVPGTPSTQISGEEADSWSVFASVGFDIMQNWSVTVGARHIDEEKDFHTAYSQTDGMPCATCATPVDDASDSWDDTVLEVSSDYHITDNMMAYLAFAQGFRSGGFSIRGVQPAFLAYEPETVDQLEIGFKGSFLEDSVQASLAWFTTETEGRQFSSIILTPGAIPGTNTFILNHDETEFDGFEAELGWTPPVIEGLGLYATFGYQSGEVSSSTQRTQLLPTGPDGMFGTADDVLQTAGPACAADGSNQDVCMTNFYSGSGVTRLPRFTYALGATYSRPIGGGTLTADLRFKHQDNFTLFPAPRVEQAEYDLFDATVAYDWEYSGVPWRVALVGKNLANEEYLEQALPVGGFQGWGPPRYIGVDFSFEYF